MRVLNDVLRSGVRDIALAVSCLGVTASCAAVVPSTYIQQAEPGMTLTRLAADPDRYRDKIVILGGVIVEEKRMGEHLFLRLKNRPLDHDYMPHRPAPLQSPEAGHYWVMISLTNLPDHYHEWARVTVVGQVTGKRPRPGDRSNEFEPVLAALYLRGWGDAVMDNGASTATIDRNYTISVPKEVQGEFGLQ